MKMIRSRHTKKRGTPHFRLFSWNDTWLVWLSEWEWEYIENWNILVISSSSYLFGSKDKNKKSGQITDHFFCSLSFFGWIVNCHDAIGWEDVNKSMMIQCWIVNYVCIFLSDWIRLKEVYMHNILYERVSVAWYHDK